MEGHRVWIGERSNLASPEPMMVRKGAIHMTPTEALSLAHAMLNSIEAGNSYTPRQWDDRLAQIEITLGRDTPRARSLSRNIASGQAAPEVGNLPKP